MNTKPYIESLTWWLQSHKVQRLDVAEVAKLGRSNDQAAASETIKQEDTKQEDVKQEDASMGGVQHEDVKMEDVKQEDVKQEDSKAEAGGGKPGKGSSGSAGKGCSPLFFVVSAKVLDAVSCCSAAEL